MEKIRIRGAKTHNLQAVDIDLPREQFVVVTGLSGSGKSSLAFDTLYAEGQRRYVESLSTYARQFLSLMQKPDADHIEGLSPAIAIEQKTSSHNPRSTVGTTTEVYDYLRLLFARVGQPQCPTHGTTLQAQTVSQMVDTVLAQEEGTRLLLLAPIIVDQKGEHTKLFAELSGQGFLRVRINGEVVELAEVTRVDGRRKNRIDVVVDRFRVRADHRLRLAESFEVALALSGGSATVAPFGNNPSQGAHEQLFSATYSCPYCDYSLPELEPRIFSFNNPAGACQRCDGLGIEFNVDSDKVIADPSVSLAAGAIAGWDRSNRYFFQLIESLANHYQFPLETPFDTLPDAVRQAILYGSGDETIEFIYRNDQNQITTKRHRFEGIIPNIKRRYTETQSSKIREDLGVFFSDQACEACAGSRLNAAARAVTINEMDLPALVQLPIGEAKDWISQLALPGQRGEIAAKICSELTQRLQFMVDVGLDYLSLDRNANTLSGGESQRIRLARQIGAGLVGVMYVLDEPSIGLHQRDNKRLLASLLRLRDLGNTVIVVEHDEEAIRSADHIVDMGPAAGIHGGEVIAQGSVDDLMASPRSVTGDFLSGRQLIQLPDKHHEASGFLSIRNACGHNLQAVDVDIPLGILTCVTGVSGSGKSTLINASLYPYAARVLNGANLPHTEVDRINGFDQLDKVINIDQSPIGRTPRSNPATYTAMFAPIRELFAATKEARSRGYTPGRFSFNVRGGRCEACQGDGLLKVEMHFLPDIYVPCDHCAGKRYNRETLEIHYKGKSIYDVLQMSVDEALEFFSAVPSVARKLETLAAVGLGYIGLGQSATTLSGGEAQRIKLSRELAKRDTGRTLYILDEPTTGLHFHDIKQLLEVLSTLRERGNTIVIIEHNLDVIKTADWLIDLGPEGGAGGGRIVATGTPEMVAKEPASHTGRFLKPLLRCAKKKPKRCRQKRVAGHAG